MRSYGQLLALLVGLALLAHWIWTEHALPVLGR